MCERCHELRNKYIKSIYELYEHLEKPNRNCLSLRKVGPQKMSEIVGYLLNFKTRRKCDN